MKETISFTNLHRIMTWVHSLQYINQDRTIYHDDDISEGYPNVIIDDIREMNSPGSNGGLSASSPWALMGDSDDIRRYLETVISKAISI